MAGLWQQIRLGAVATSVAALIAGSAAAQDVVITPVGVTVDGNLDPLQSYSTLFGVPIGNSFGLSSSGPIFSNGVQTGAVLTVPTNKNNRTIIFEDGSLTVDGILQGITPSSAILSMTGLGYSELGTVNTGVGANDPTFAHFLSDGVFRGFGDRTETTSLADPAHPINGGPINGVLTIADPGNAGTPNYILSISDRTQYFSVGNGAHDSTSITVRDLDHQVILTVLEDRHSLTLIGTAPEVAKTAGVNFDIPNDQLEVSGNIVVATVDELLGANHFALVDGVAGHFPDIGIQVSDSFTNGSLSVEGSTRASAIGIFSEIALTENLTLTAIDRAFGIGNLQLVDGVLAASSIANSEIGVVFDDPTDTFSNNTINISDSLHVASSTLLLTGTNLRVRNALSATEEARIGAAQKISTAADDASASATVRSTHIGVVLGASGGALSRLNDTITSIDDSDIAARTTGARATAGFRNDDIGTANLGSVELRVEQEVTGLTNLFRTPSFLLDSTIGVLVENTATPQIGLSGGSTSITDTDLVVEATGLSAAAQFVNRGGLSQGFDLASVRQTALTTGLVTGAFLSEINIGIGTDPGFSSTFLLEDHTLNIRDVRISGQSRSFFAHASAVTRGTGSPTGFGPDNTAFTPSRIQIEQTVSIDSQSLFTELEEINIGIRNGAVSGGSVTLNIDDVTVISDAIVNEAFLAVFAPGQLGQSTLGTGEPFQLRFAQVSSRSVTAGIGGPFDDSRSVVGISHSGGSLSPLTIDAPLTLNLGNLGGATDTLYFVSQAIVNDATVSLDESDHLVNAYANIVHGGAADPASQLTGLNGLGFARLQHVSIGTGRGLIFNGSDAPLSVTVERAAFDAALTGNLFTLDIPALNLISPLDGGVGNGALIRSGISQANNNGLTTQIDNIFVGLYLHAGSLGGTNSPVNVSIDNSSLPAGIDGSFSASVTGNSIVENVPDIAAPVNELDIFLGTEANPHSQNAANNPVRSDLGQPDLGGVERAVNVGLFGEAASFGSAASSPINVEITGIHGSSTAVLNNRQTNLGAINVSDGVVTGHINQTAEASTSARANVGNVSIGVRIASAGDVGNVDIALNDIGLTASSTSQLVNATYGTVATLNAPRTFSATQNNSARSNASIAGNVNGPIQIGANITGTGAANGAFTIGGPDPADAVTLTSQARGNAFAASFAAATFNNSTSGIVASQINAAGITAQIQGAQVGFTAPGFAAGSEIRIENVGIRSRAVGNESIGRIGAP